jgi:glycosyltransferase involved in cell wall biosynthesis
MNGPSSAPTRPRALIFGSFAETNIASGLDTALENLRGSPLASSYELVVVSLYRGETSNRSLIPRLAFGTWLLVRLICRFALERPAVADVHAVSGRDLLKNGAVVLAARATGVPVLLRIHGGNFASSYESARGVERSIVRWILRAADRVVVLSRRWEDVARSIEPAARTAVIPNSVDCDQFAGMSARRPSSAQDVLMLASFCERKGHFDAVRAAAMLKDKHPATKFLFFGSERDAGALAALRETARAESVSKSVEFLEPVFGRDKLEQIASASVFILPSHTENMPMAIMEAMAAGLPVVATTVGAIPEMIEDGKTGLLLEPRQPDQLAGAIARLLEDPGFRRRIGERAAEAARRSWDKSVVGEMTAKLYDTVRREHD